MSNTGNLTVDELSHLFSEQVDQASVDWLIGAMNFLKVQLHTMPEKRRRAMILFLSEKLIEKVRHPGFLESK